MSVTACKEIFEGRGARVDDNGVVTIARVLTVSTDDKTDGPVTVVAGLRYPEDGVDLGSTPIKIFDPHPDYRAAVLRGADATATASPTEWHVTLNYSSAPFPARQQDTGSTALPGPTGSPTTPSNDPSSGSTLAKPATERIPTWTYSVKTTQEPGERYYDWVSSTIKPYVNPCGDPIEGLQVERYTLCMSVTYYSSEMTDTEIANRVGVVNLATYRGFPAGGVIVRDIKREDVWDFLGYDADGFEVFGLVWKVTIDLEAVNQYEFWQTKTLNTGRRGRLSAGGPIVTLFDRAGERVADPVAMDADGVVLRDPALAAPTAIAASEFTYTTFYDRNRFDFDDLLI